jgi:hypothetical protein
MPDTATRQPPPEKSAAELIAQTIVYRNVAKPPALLRAAAALVEGENTVLTAKTINFGFSEFLLTPRPNHLHIPRRPAPLRGALRNVTNVGAGCGGRGRRA